MRDWTKVQYQSAAISEIIGREINDGRTTDVNCTGKNSPRLGLLSGGIVAVASAGEAITGLILLADPPIVVRLLFGAEIDGAGAVVGRIAGISLIALGLACWPGNGSSRALFGMLMYSSLAAVYLLYLGLAGKWIGSLLWPAVAAHIILTILLARVWVKEQRTPAPKTSH